MFLILGSSLIAFLAIARMANAEDSHGQGFMTWLRLLVSSLLMFSFVHYDTWLHGWALVHDLGDTCAILSISVLMTSKREPVRRLVVAWMLCFIEGLCYLGGLVGRFAIIPSVWVLSEDRRMQVLASIGSVGLCAGCLLLFKLAFTFWHLRTDRLFWLKHPSFINRLFPWSSRGTTRLDRIRICSDCRLCDRSCFRLLSC
jgi:hypothetical protein